MHYWISFFRDICTSRFSSCLSGYRALGDSKFQDTKIGLESNKSVCSMKKYANWTHKRTSKHKNSFFSHNSVLDFVTTSELHSAITSPSCDVEKSLIPRSTYLQTLEFTQRVFKQFNLIGNVFRSSFFHQGATNYVQIIFNVILYSAA